jgi:hypothetical protein
MMFRKNGTNETVEAIIRTSGSASGGSGTPANTSTLTLSPSSARLGHSVGSSVTFTLANGGTALDAKKLDACYEITRRAQDGSTPAGGINKAANPSSCNWIPEWGGNAEWDKVNGSKDLQWKLEYTPAAFDICKGVQIVIAFRHRDTGQVTYSVLEADGRPANDACHGSGSSGNTSGYYWHESAGVFSPQPPMCSSMGLSPNHGSPCTQPNVGCQANGNEYRCSQGVPAPKSLAVEAVDTQPSIPEVIASTAGQVINVVVIQPAVEIVETFVEVVGSVWNGLNDLVSFD